MAPHGEAFKLMQYQAEDLDTPAANRGTTGPIEWLWNSRDGVTPFVIGKPQDGDDPSDEGASGFMRHINWPDDILALQYVPNVGQRVFVDITEERARYYLRRNVERQWAEAKDGEYHPAGRWKDKDAMFDDMLSDALEEVVRGGPDIVTVTEGMQILFMEERERRRQFMTPRRVG